MNAVQQLVAACTVMVLLVTVVGARMLFVRVQEMRRKRLHPQAVATSVQVAAKLESTQASDNFRNLFEVPVLFYVLCVMAVASGHTPAWLVNGAWVFVALRIAHSVVHCSYNKVMHRLAVFAAGFTLLIVMWLGFMLTLPGWFGN